MDCTGSPSLLLTMRSSPPALMRHTLPRNDSPRDAKGQIGAFEAALMGTPMVNPEQPLEILRTLHSFDPCLACSTHVMSPDGQEMAAVKVR